ALFWIDFRVGSFDVNRAQHAGRAVTWTSHVNHVEVEHFYDTIQVRIYKGERGAGAPVSEHARFDMFGLQFFTQQRVVLKVDHAEGQIIRGPPKRVQLFQFLITQRRA